MFPYRVHALSFYCDIKSWIHYSAQQKTMLVSLCTLASKSLMFTQRDSTTLNTNLIMCVFLMVHILLR